MLIVTERGAEGIACNTVTKFLREQHVSFRAITGNDGAIRVCK